MSWLILLLKYCRALTPSEGDASINSLEQVKGWFCLEDFPGLIILVYISNKFNFLKQRFLILASSSLSNIRRLVGELGLAVCGKWDQLCKVPSDDDDEDEDDNDDIDEDNYDDYDHGN